MGGGGTPGKQLIFCVPWKYFSFILCHVLKDIVSWDFLCALPLTSHNSSESRNSRLEVVLFVQPTCFLVVAGRETWGYRTAYFCLFFASTCYRPSSVRIIMLDESLVWCSGAFLKFLCVAGFTTCIWYLGFFSLGLKQDSPSWRQCL